jgi:pimeloyl-ACP methyl ester carboxylesterase
MTSLPTLPPPLPAATRILRGRAGEVALHVAGQGPPMLMLHSINAAASAYEIRPAFEAMLSSHRVFAPDLPGNADKKGDGEDKVGTPDPTIKSSRQAANLK